MPRVIPGQDRLRDPLLSASERVLLHLSSLRDDPGDRYGADIGRTSERIRTAVNVSSSHLQRVIRQLRKEGLVELRVGKPRGAKVQCQYAVLSPGGRSRAGEVRKRLDGLKVKMNMGEPTMKEISDGNSVGGIPGDDGGDGKEDAPHWSGVDEIPFMELPARLDESELPPPFSHAYIASFIDRGGRLHFNSLKRSLESEKVRLLSGAPAIGQFYGREEELDQYTRDLARPGLRALAVHGLPGVGKSTLASKLARGLAGEYHILWLNIKEYTTRNRLLSGLVDLATGIAGENARFPEIGALSPDIALFCDLFLSTLKGEPVLVVLDDVHKADADVIRVISELIEEPRSGGSGLRLLLLMRFIPRIYDRRAVLRQGLAVERELEGLDRDSALKLLRGMGVPEDRAPEVFDRTRGVPFYMEVSLEPGELSRHLEQEVVPALDETRKDILGVLSTYRMPVPPEALLRHPDASLSDVNALLDRSYIKVNEDGSLFVHEILGDYFFRGLSPVEKVKVHRHCADFLESWKGGSYNIERIYHLLGAGDAETAASLFVEWAPESITGGHCHEMMEMMDDFRPRDLNSGSWALLNLSFSRVLVAAGNLQKAWGTAIISMQKAGEAGEKRTECLAMCQLQFLYEDVKDPAYDPKEILQEAKRISDELDDSEIKVKVLVGFVRQDWLDSEHGLGIRAAEEALSILEGNPGIPLKGTLLIDLANIYWDMGDYERTKEITNSALKALEETGDLMEISRAYQLKGLALGALGDLDGAIDNIGKCVEFSEMSLVFHHTIYSNINIAHAYAMKGDYDRARAHLDRVRDRAFDENITNIVQKVHRTEAIISEGEGRPDEADDGFGKALEIALLNFPSFSHNIWEEYILILVRREDKHRAAEELSRAKAHIDPQNSRALARMEALERRIGDLS